MAEVQKNTGFDFGGFLEQIGEQREKTAARQQVEVATQRKQNEIKERSTRAAQQYESNMDPLRAQIRESATKAAHARKLADSGNPLDTLRLMGLQASDPGGYRRDVRQARLSEDMHRASAIGQVHGVTQQALNYELLSSSNQLDLVKLEETIGLERLKQIQEEAALYSGNLAASLTMQQGAIQNMDESELEAAVGAAKNAGKAVNIGGVDIGATMLEDRLTALKERRYQMLVRQNMLTLAEDDSRNINDVLKQREHERRINRDARENIGHTLAYNEAQRKIQSDEIQGVDSTIRANKAKRTLSDDAASDVNVQAEMDSRNFARYERQKEIIRESQKRELDTYNDQEILQMRKNGYRSVGGEQYHRDDVDAAYTRRQQVNQDWINSQVIEHNLAGFDKTALIAEDSRLKSITPRFRENTPAAEAARQYQAALGLFTKSVDSEDMAARLVGYAQFQSAKASFDKVITAQAKAESNGDKGKEDLLVEYYRGNPVPKATLQTTLQERLVKNKPVNDILPPAVALRVQRRYIDAYQAKLTESKGNMLQTPGAEDKKMWQAEAAQEAIQWGINESITGRTESILSGQVSHPSHPLFGWTPAKMVGVLKQADDTAFKDWKGKNGLDDAQALTIQGGGKLADRDDSPALLNELKAMENTQLIMELNGIDGELGTRVAKWWEVSGQDYLQAEQQAYDSTTVQNSFEETQLRALAGQQELDSMFQYGVGLTNSDSDIENEHLQRRADFLTFGGNPENTQAMLLHFDQNLKDAEKALVMKDIIGPLLVEAGTRGLTYQETNSFVERGIMNAEPANGELKRILKTVRRDRENYIQMLGDIQTMGHRFQNIRGLEQIARTMGGNPRAGFGAPVPQSTNPYASSNASKMGWFLKLKAEGGQVPNQP